MKNFLFSTFTAEFGWVCPFFCWVWVGVSFYGMNVGDCGYVWVSVTFFGWVWVGVGECDLFLAGCGWMWVSVTFFWLDVHFKLHCRSHFQLHQIFKMMFFSSSFPVFPKRFTCFLKIRERGSRILKTVNNLPYANIHIVILLSLCRNILCACIYYCINETLSKEKL